MPTKTIVCLANSFRHGGSCVAGIEYENGEFGSWVRPVSHRGNRAISDIEKTYADGQLCNVLDLVEIDLDRYHPEAHQTENWLITEGVSWRKIGELQTADLAGAVQNPANQLWNSMASTYHGRCDTVNRIFLNGTTNSLELIQPDVAQVEVVNNDYHPERNDVWVAFQWAGREYKFKLTDPVQFQRFAAAGLGRHVLQHPMMCISLAEIWEETGTASKLVAGLIL